MSPRLRLTATAHSSPAACTYCVYIAAGIVRAGARTLRRTLRPLVGTRARTSCTGMCARPARIWRTRSPSCTRWPRGRPCGRRCRGGDAAAEFES
ncbi:hypothetical protein F511_47246 [Dorcoceras hygrometricum]|uniref:Uncharacterized protein n=1 Tax=Dorcoceras hygrometricum TaxID=472368 RepID=A0A2Z6ZS32_9LAMI|nr:hypothetical protein F511_47246 [Dorcoceras hygrometricum]